MAWLAGKVHGVVVQITASTASNCSPENSNTCATASASKNSNATSKAGDTLSLYSTSASAKAEPHSKQKCTGFSPFTK